MVTWFEPCHAFTNFLDDSGTLMTTDDGERKWKVTCCEVFVGMAHSGCNQFDEHFARFRVIELDFLDTPRCIDFPENCGLGLH